MRRDLQYDRRLKTPTNAETFVKYLRLSIKSGEHLLLALRGLAPPPSDVVAFRRLLAAENGADLIANHFVDEYGDMTVHRFKHLVRRSRILDRRIHARAKRLGMRVCAKD